MDRLKTLAYLTKGYNSIADIGSDHAYVCIDAVLNYNILKAYACDINEGPLANAKKNILSNNLEDKIKTVLSDGLKDLNVDVDAIIISGMGGLLIRDILKSSLEKALMVKALILEPNTEAALLREFLFENGFTFENELIVYDHKHYYEIMVVFPKRCMNYNIDDINYGPILRKQKSELFIEMYKHKIIQFKKAYDKATKVDVKLRLFNQIKKLEEVIDHE